MKYHWQTAKCIVTKSDCRLTEKKGADSRCTAASVALPKAKTTGISGPLRLSDSRTLGLSSAQALKLSSSQVHKSSRSPSRSQALSFQFCSVHNALKTRCQLGTLVDRKIINATRFATFAARCRPDTGSKPQRKERQRKTHKHSVLT
jgi:hypothetical protein